MYDELFEVWRKEKENGVIQLLPKGFYARLAEYVMKIREEERMVDEKTVKGRLLRKEGENVSNMARELVRIRYEKLMRVIAKGDVVPATSLSVEEERFCRDGSSLADFFQAFLKNLLQGRISPQEKKGSKGILIVRILQEIPEIVGADMKRYGPFMAEDVATLPKENARTLIKQKLAVEIESQ